MASELGLVGNITVVGIGAFVGGYLSFATQAFIQSRTSDRERQKELRERLYTITGKLGKSFESIAHYIASTVIYNNNTDDEIAKSKYEDADEESLADWKSLLSIPIELKMLGFTKTSQLAAEYFTLLSQSAEMVEGIIEMGNDSKRQALCRKYEQLMDSVSLDYHKLFQDIPNA